VRQSVRVPGAFIPAHFTAGWIGTLALSTLVATLVFGYRSRWAPRRGGWWPPFVVVALVLIFGVSYG
jgi:competence protein ComEC